jgi:hypothetical protein
VLGIAASPSDGERVVLGDQASPVRGGQVLPGTGAHSRATNDGLARAIVFAVAAFGLAVASIGVARRYV